MANFDFDTTVGAVTSTSSLDNLISKSDFELLLRNLTPTSSFTMPAGAGTQAPDTYYNFNTQSAGWVAWYNTNGVSGYEGWSTVSDAFSDTNEISTGQTSTAVTVKSANFETLFAGHETNGWNITSSLNYFILKSGSIEVVIKVDSTSKEIQEVWTSPSQNDTGNDPVPIINYPVDGNGDPTGVVINPDQSAGLDLKVLGELDDPLFLCDVSVDAVSLGGLPTAGTLDGTDPKKLTVTGNTELDGDLNITGSVTIGTVIGTAYGGTGLSTIGTANQILQSDGSSLSWVDNTPTLASLTDTTWTGLASGDILKYDGTAQVWVNATGYATQSYVDAEITTVLTTQSTKADKATTITAGTGLSGGGSLSANRTLALDLSELASATVSVSTDFIPILDGGSNGSSRKESIADLVSEIAGEGLTTNGSGVMKIDIPGLSGMSSGNIASDDELLIYDTGATINRGVTFGNLVSKMAGTGLSATNGVLNAAGDLDGLSDVNITSPGSGSILYYDGSWKDSDSVQVDASTGNVGIGGTADSSAALAVTGSFKLGSDTAIPSLVAPAGGLELTASGMRIQPSGNSSLRAYIVGPQDITSISVASGVATINTTVDHNLSTGATVTIAGVTGSGSINAHHTITVPAGGPVGTHPQARTSFTLDGFTASGSYTGGTWSERTYTYAEKSGERETTGITVVYVKDKFPNLEECLRWLKQNAAGHVNIFFETGIEETRPTQTGFRISDSFKSVSLYPGVFDTVLNRSVVGSCNLSAHGTKAACEAASGGVWTESVQNLERKLWRVNLQTGTASNQYLFYTSDCDLSIFGLKMWVKNCDINMSHIFLQSGGGSLLRLGGCDIVVEGEELSITSTSTAGNTAVITQTAHGLSNGDYVRITGATGMTNINNSAAKHLQTWKIDNATTDTYTLEDLNGVAIVANAALTNTPTVKTERSSRANSIITCSRGARFNTDSRVTGTSGTHPDTGESLTLPNSRLQIDMSDMLGYMSYAPIRAIDSSIIELLDNGGTNISPVTDEHSCMHFYGGSVNAFATDIRITRLFYFYNFSTIKIHAPITRAADCDIRPWGSTLVPYYGYGYGVWAVTADWHDIGGTAHPNFYFPANDAKKLGTAGDTHLEGDYVAARAARKVDSSYTSDGSIMETGYWAYSDHQAVADAATDAAATDPVTGTTPLIAPRSIISSTVLTTNPLN